MTGIPTIRAYGMETNFVHSNQNKLDDSIRATFISFMSQRWLSARLDFLGNLLVAAAGILICVVKNSIPGSVIGLALTYALQVTGLYVHYHVNMGLACHGLLDNFQRLKQACLVWKEFCTIQPMSPMKLLPLLQNIDPKNHGLPQVAWNFQILSCAIDLIYHQY